MQPSEKKTTGSTPEGKVAKAASPDIDDPWGRLDAARRAFYHKGGTYPAACADMAEILTYLPDPAFRQEVVKALRRHLGTEQGKTGLARQAARSFSRNVKDAAARAPGDPRQAAAWILCVLESMPLLLGGCQPRFDVDVVADAIAPLLDNPDPEAIAKAVLRATGVRPRYVQQLYEPPY